MKKEILLSASLHVLLSKIYKENYERVSVYSSAADALFIVKNIVKNTEKLEMKAVYDLLYLIVR